MSNITNTTAVSTSFRPVKKGGYTQRKANIRRNQRRNDADARQSKYDSLSVAEKMKHAGKKELAKLTKKYGSTTPTVSEPIVSTVAPTMFPMDDSPKKTASKKLAKKKA